MEMIQDIDIPDSVLQFSEEAHRAQPGVLEQQWVKSALLLACLHAYIAQAVS